MKRTYISPLCSEGVCLEFQILIVSNKQPGGSTTSPSSDGGTGVYESPGRKLYV